ncbi:hypothetical protein IV498_10915 [Paenarthrobacter sp. Z7-10]|uniref:hypothetical protein n=1 Tax=Paenarthrobacter sp. Z7-10 TaxID=2787635 RepID=UPI0022A950F3|nr:hypothetical protein [Paenarthrobacter sp. Z7-10]MCZ2403680.1 hypothetical protein [Paenarthrobacter sp. Z7-10]
MTHEDVRSRLISKPVAVVAAMSMLLVGAGTATAAAPAAAKATGALGAHVGTATAATPAAAKATGAPVVPAPSSSAPLTNLSHLNFLLDTVPLKPVAGHTTYQLDQQPTAQAPWTYANKNADGSYTRVGGGTQDPATGTWSQGAFNADDIARTAVVYLRHWRQTGDAASREHAFQTLRALTYLQTSSGPNAGNVVLWQQADGTLNPSAIPKELPDPSDSAESYWLARTLWALGEGYAAFQSTDPQFAAFLADRMHLSIDALNRQSLAKYGQFDVADGVKVPAWLITGGADASAEAVLGLAAYAKAAPDDGAVGTALRQLTEGIADMSAGSTRQWPFGAIMPSVTTRSLWHAWGGMAPAAVATAATVLHRPDLLTAAVKDSARFTPQLLAAGGPDNAWSPVPGEAQIAYGADSRVESLVATAKAAHAPGLLDVAAVAAGWFFGANRAGVPTYNPATGTAIDGIETDGRINPNSGAESTIHTLLTMLALDANPALKAKALGITHTVSTVGLSVVEAESGTVTGGSVVKPAGGAWTGEANLSGGAYVALDAGGSVAIPVPAANQPRKVYPIVNQSVAPAGRTAWTFGTIRLGGTPNGGAGDQGVTPTPGILYPFALDRPLPAFGPGSRHGHRAVAGTTEGNSASASTGDPSTRTAAAVVGRSNGPAAIDALLLQPEISSVSVSGSGGNSTLYVSADTRTTVRKVDLPKGFKLQQEAFDSSGRPVAAGHSNNGADHSGRVTVAPGGFTWVTLVRK